MGLPHLLGPGAGGFHRSHASGRPWREVVYGWPSWTVSSKARKHSGYHDDGGHEPLQDVGQSELIHRASKADIDIDRKDRFIRFWVHKRTSFHEQKEVSWRTLILALRRSYRFRRGLHVQNTDACRLRA